METDKSFKYKDKEYGINFLKSGGIEIFEANNVATTGFVFDDMKATCYFINMLTDIVEDFQKRGPK